MMLEGDVTISKLLWHYGINYDNFSFEQKEVLEGQGVITNIKHILDFLINEVGVEAKKIEKCPSVLYLNTDCVRTNYENLINFGINKDKIEGCLHILSSEPYVIQNTFKYIRDNYGMETFNKNVSILGVPTRRIIEIEEKFGNRLSKQAILSAAITTLRMAELSTILMICEEKGVEVTGSFFQKGVGQIGEIINIFQSAGVEVCGSAFRKNAYEVKRIIDICKEKNVEITGSVFLKDSFEVDKIIDTCRKHNIPISGSVFRRDALEIEDIVAVCNELGIEVSGTVFLRKADEIRKIHDVCSKYGIELTATVFKKSALEIEEIVQVCERYGLEVTGTLFKKSASSLEKSMKYVKENYGGIYMVPLIVVTDFNHLQKVFPYLEKKGTLSAVVDSPAILTLKYDEMLEREKVISSIGQEDVINGRFNSIYGLSRKLYDKKLTEIELGKGVINK